MIDLVLRNREAIENESLWKMINSLPFFVALSILGIYRNSNDPETMNNVRSWLKDYKESLPLPYVSKIETDSVHELTKNLPDFEKQTIVLILESFQLGVIPFMAERKIDKANNLINLRIRSLTAKV